MIVKSVSTRGAFGVLDYKWDHSELQDFLRFNLIYGWNRSGKTTLSRVFEACEKKTTAFKQYPAGGDFEIRTDTGSRVASGNLDSCELAVRVFNEDFVDDNVSFDESECRPIVYISEEDIASQQQLKTLNGATEDLEEARAVAKKDRASAERIREEFLKATARSIKDTVGNLKLADQYRTYDRGKLENLLGRSDRTTFVELSDEDFEESRATIGSDPKPLLVELSARTQSVAIGSREVASLDDMQGIVDALVGRKVVSQTLERLKKDPELNAWVKNGFDLQQDRSALDSCPYCEKPLDPGFLERLSRHFSEDYVAVQTEAGEILDALEAAKRDMPDDHPELYPEFVKPYAASMRSLEKANEELNGWIDACCNALRAKIDSPLAVVVKPGRLPDRLEERYATLLDAVNSVIRRHNAKVSNHTDEVVATKARLANHIVAVAMREQGYEQMEKDVQDAVLRDGAAATTLSEHHEAIARLHRRASNVGKAVDRINEHLSDFFGRDEIQLELDAQSKGYAIRREGRAASNLSGGEKTAIAFSYFLAKVQERDFSVRGGVIVIDDPVSSLDSNFIFHCFSLMKVHFREAGQLFVLTHNFDLFNLAKAWFIAKNRDCRSGGRAECCGFYTVENRLIGSVRQGYLAPMDATLRDFNSEYQYLFTRLKRFADQDTPEYADLYTLGNIARRFLEVFAGFKVPTTGDLRSKVGKLPTPRVTEVQKEKVYRLVQEYSHGGDPTVAVAHKDKCESQEAVRILLRIVEDADQPHFAVLARSVRV